MKRYQNDLTGGHTIETYQMPDGRFRARIENNEVLKGKEWFGDSSSEATTIALNEIARLEELGEV